MTTKARNWLIAGFIVAFPFTLFLLFLLFLGEGPLPMPLKMPVLNAYGDFVSAGKMVQDEGDVPFSKMDEATLKVFVAANSNAVALGRIGLQKECRVPVQYSMAYLSNHLDDLSAVKDLSRAFAAEGRLAELERHTNQAVQAYVETVRLGNEISRGGMLIDELVGIAVEAIGIARLQDVTPRLDGGTSRATASALETIDSQAQTWDDVMQQEDAWFHANYHGWYYYFLRWESRKVTEPAIKSARKKIATAQENRRRLLLDLAAHAYELDKGHPPAGVNDLVPDYLKAVPKDPVTGAEMSLK